MELWEQKIERLKETAVPWAGFCVVLLGDIQYGTKDTDVSALKDIVSWGVERDAWWLNLGDNLDIASPSNRGILRAAGFYDSVEDALRTRVEDLQEELHEILAPTKGRWLGVVEGHHWYPFEDGTTTDTRLARFLGAPFLGNCGIVRVKAWNPAAGKWGYLRIWCAHGQGSGVTVGSPLNLLHRLSAHFEADVFAIGHYSRLACTAYDRLYDSGKNIHSRTKVLVVSGAYTRGYTLGRIGANRPEGSYVEKRLLPPTTIGSSVLFVEPYRDRTFGCLFRVQVMLRPA